MPSVSVRVARRVPFVGCQRRGIRALPDQHRWGEQGGVGQNQRLALPVEPQIRVNPRLVEGLRITRASSDR